MRAPTFAVLLVLFTVGCDKGKVSEREAKLANLEARATAAEESLAKMQQENQLLSGKLTNLANIIVENNDRVLGVVADLARLQKKSNEEHERDYQTLQAALSNSTMRGAVSPRFTPAQPQAVARPAPIATRDGVPVSIYNQIAAEAAQKWPGNYQMQEYTIRNQIESYRKLHP